MVFPGSSAGKESTSSARDPGLIPGSGSSPGEGKRVPTPVFMGFPGSSDGKELACNVEDLGSVPGLGRSPGERIGYPLQYSCLENPNGQRSLVGYSPWCLEALDTTYRLSTAHSSEALLLCFRIPPNNFI